MKKKHDNNKEVIFGPCCFCGLQIDQTDIDPCRITVETNKEKWQVWFCHSKCFKDRINKNAEIDLSPAHF